MQIKRLASSLSLVLLLAMGCRSDDTLNPPPAPPVPGGGAMFQRYVSMGNSITAGFQSAGINDSTQRRSYAVLLAAAMGADFTYPSLQGRGCTPPFTNNVTQARVGGGTGTTCDLRADNSVPSNLAVPGARVIELFNNFGVPVSSSNALTLLFLGGKTQLERMVEQRPTFVSVWIGNNDVLGAFTTLPSAANPTANPGDTLKLTPQATFATQYDSVLNAIDSAGAEAVLISVADVTSIPYASLGVLYYCLKNGGCPPPLPAQLPQLAGIPTFQVSPTCSPLGVGLTTLVPWPIGLNMVQDAIDSLVAGGGTLTLDCSISEQVITTAEIAALRTAVAGYNAHIQAEATARNWAYFDINPALQAELQSAANPTGRIPPFPDALPAFNNPPGSVTFGPLFTLDGVHPSSLAHQLVADSVASAINQTYGTTLPVPVCGTVTCPAP